MSKPRSSKLPHDDGKPARFHLDHRGAGRHSRIHVDRPPTRGPSGRGSRERAEGSGSLVLRSTRPGYHRPLPFQRRWPRATADCQADGTWDRGRGDDLRKHGRRGVGNDKGRCLRLTDETVFVRPVEPYGPSCTRAKIAGEKGACARGNDPKPCPLRRYRWDFTRADPTC